MNHDKVLIMRLEQGVEPVAGDITDRDGGRRSFHGWIELVAAIDAARLVTVTSVAPEQEQEG